MKKQLRAALEEENCQKKCIQCKTSHVPRQPQRSETGRRKREASPRLRSHTNQEQERLTKMQRSRTSSDRRNTHENDPNLPSVAAPIDANLTKRINQTARMRGRLENTILKRPKRHRNRHDLTETAESKENIGMKDQPSCLRQPHSFDTTIMEYRCRLKHLDLSLLPKMKELSFVNWPFPTDDNYRRNGKSSHQAHPQQARPTPSTNDSSLLYTEQSICTYLFPSDGVCRGNRTIPQQAKLHWPFSLAKQRLQKLRLERQASKKGL